MWSNPPAHGARVVAGVLKIPELKAEWHDNIKTMSSRVARMRQLLHAALVAKGCPGSWEHILAHIGMFTFTGLSGTTVSLAGMLEPN